LSTIRLTLPDGSVREVPSGTTGLELARQIGPGLAKAALAIRVGDQIRDLNRPISDDATVSILTDRDPDALELLRHSAAHALATAVREVFPQAGIGFGPPIEDGFYYDFDVPRPFTPEDLEKIEGVMREEASLLDGAAVAIVPSDEPALVSESVRRADSAAMVAPSAAALAAAVAAAGAARSLSPIFITVIGIPRAPAIKPPT